MKQLTQTELNLAIQAQLLSQSGFTATADSIVTIIRDARNGKLIKEMRK